MPIRPLGPSAGIPQAIRDWTEAAASSFNRLEETVRGQPPAPRAATVEQLERLEGEQALNESALAGLRGEAAKAAAERLQAARDRATLAARVSALEARANVGAGAIAAGIDPLAPPGLAPGEEPAPAAPALPDYLGTGGARVLVATQALIGPAQGALPGWVRASTAPAEVYIVRAAEYLSPIAIPAANAASYIRWEVSIKAQDGTTVQATIRAPVRQAGSATAVVPYTSGTMRTLDMTITNRLSIAADGANAVGDTILIFQSDAVSAQITLAAGNTYPGSADLYLVPVA